jgi:hypothetical protein
MAGGRWRTFEHWVVVHDNRDHADVRQVPPRPTDDVLLIEPLLSRVVKATVVHLVVVSLGQQIDVTIVLLVHLEHAVNNRDVAPSQLEDDNVPNSVWVFRRDLHRKSVQFRAKVDGRGSRTRSFNTPHGRRTHAGVCNAHSTRGRTQLLRNNMSPRWNAGSILPLRRGVDSVCCCRLASCGKRPS